jgi:hypothetical protein
MIRRHKLKCTICGEIYEIVEEKLFSRLSNDDSNPECGYLVLTDIDGNCPKSTQKIHEKCKSIPLPKGEDDFAIKNDIREFDSKESWLHHLKFFYKTGISIQYRQGNIGREELMGKDLEGLTYEDRSGEEYFSDEEILHAFGRKPRTNEKVSVLYNKTTGRIVSSLDIGSFVFRDLNSIGKK